MNKLENLWLARQRKKRRNSKYKQRIKKGMALPTQKDYNEYYEQLYANKSGQIPKKTVITKTNSKRKRKSEQTYNRQQH